MLYNHIPVLHVQIRTRIEQLEFAGRSVLASKLVRAVNTIDPTAGKDGGGVAAELWFSDSGIPLHHGGTDDFRSTMSQRN